MNTNIKSENLGFLGKVCNFFGINSNNQPKFSEDINVIVQLHFKNPDKVERLLDVLRRYKIDPTGMSTEELKAAVIKIQRAQKEEDSWYKDDSDLDLE